MDDMTVWHPCPHCRALTHFQAAFCGRCGFSQADWQRQLNMRNTEDRLALKIGKAVVHEQAKYDAARWDAYQKASHAYWMRAFWIALPFMIIFFLWVVSVWPR